MPSTLLTVRRPSSVISIRGLISPPLLCVAHEAPCCKRSLRSSIKALDTRDKLTDVGQDVQLVTRVGQHRRQNLHRRRIITLPYVALLLKLGRRQFDRGLLCASCRAFLLR